MIYLKCLLVISIFILPAFCIDTVPITTQEPTEDGTGTDSTDVVTVIVSTSYKPTVPAELMQVLSNITAPTVDGNVTFRSMNRTTSAGVKRRVLIINQPMLRQSLKKRKNKKKDNKDQDPRLAAVESLLYEEYDTNGEKLVEIMMYSMEDVSRFFQSYLHTQVCYGQCETALS